MGLLKWAIVGAAAAYGIKHITKKRVEDGKSIIDDWNERAPEWIEKAKQYTDEAVNKVNSRVSENYQ
ncbi:YtxH domain-containing protein [Mucilaginibacter galii]|uniref:YtxH domain-containing protein n=1 Tax=Mucilaginibacter galii TaxID=2005073 RepID=A0A917JAC5_9SPHI|nr:YtxH domain-containing protein [Mucilaginibacter galii]GGI50039.1 hypothetical protein GCM10011425_12510 [Mucilaginibacter galii]